MEFDNYIEPTWIKLVPVTIYSQSTLDVTINKPHVFLSKSRSLPLRNYMIILPIHNNIQQQQHEKDYIPHLWDRSHKIPYISFISHLRVLQNLTFNIFSDMSNSKKTASEIQIKVWLYDF